MNTSRIVRPATPSDAAAIALIYNQGIEDRIATFETDARTEADVRQWLGGKHPVVVVTEGGDIVAFAATFPTSVRRCYAGNAEFSVYVARERRGEGLGRVAMTKLVEAAKDAGLTKLVSRVFPENVASMALLRKLGFREVGTYERHGQLDGVWRDVVSLERLLSN